MIKLILDIGNTNLKAAFWHGKVMAKKFDSTSLTALSSKETLKKYGVPEWVVISSVLKLNPTVKKFFSVQNQLLVSHKTPVPVKIKYKTPETLGHDRLANAVGAFTMFPGYPVLVVDAGTCVKFDFVDSRANYLGGSISPGLKMRFAALNYFTAKLPLVKFNRRCKLIGQSTQEAIISGVQAGIIAETNGMIEQYQKKYKELKVVLTGGDFRFFAGNLKKHIFVAPNLTLMGLNEILDYNTN